MSALASMKHPFKLIVLDCEQFQAVFTRTELHNAKPFNAPVTRAKTYASQSFYYY